MNVFFIALPFSGTLASSDEACTAATERADPAQNGQHGGTTDGVICIAGQYSEWIIVRLLSLAQPSSLFPLPSSCEPRSLPTPVIFATLVISRISTMTIDALLHRHCYTPPLAIVVGTLLSRSLALLPYVQAIVITESDIDTLFIFFQINITLSTIYCLLSAVMHRRLVRVQVLPRHMLQNPKTQRQSEVTVRK